MHAAHDLNNITCGFFHMHFSARCAIGIIVCIIGQLKRFAHDKQNE